MRSEEDSERLERAASTSSANVEARFDPRRILKEMELDGAGRVRNVEARFDPRRILKGDKIACMIKRISG